jgi:hypothetical protein
MYESIGNTKKLLKELKAILSLFEEEGMIKPRAEFYRLAAFEANRLGLEKEALRFAGLSKKYSTYLFGLGSREVILVEDLENDPEGHPTRGVQITRDE